MAGKNGTSKRELMDTGNDKCYTKRDEKGRFDEAGNGGRSISQASASRTKRSTQSAADELALRAWKTTYHNRHDGKGKD
jgi:hypothetical protein